MKPDLETYNLESRNKVHCYLPDDKQMSILPLGGR